MALDDDTLQRYFDGELSPVEERSVRGEVQGNAQAQARLRQLAELSELVRTRKVTAYDGRETAPAAATPQLFYDDAGKPLNFIAAVTSGRSTGVPGAVAMLALAQKKHGKLAWRDLFGEAERLAVEGFPVGFENAGQHDLAVADDVDLDAVGHQPYEARRFFRVAPHCPERGRLVLHRAKILSRSSTAIRWLGPVVAQKDGARLRRDARRRTRYDTRSFGRASVFDAITAARRVSWLWLHCHGAQPPPESPPRSRRLEFCQPRRGEG